MTAQEPPDAPRFWLLSIPSKVNSYFFVFFYRLFRNNRNLHLIFKRDNCYSNGITVGVFYEKASYAWIGFCDIGSGKCLWAG
jgi:hypothetical protein